MKPLKFLLLLHALVIVTVLVLLIRQKGQPIPDKEKILILNIEGIISEDRESMAGESVEMLVETINEAREDDSVKALVLRINSPGGSVGAVQEITSSLKKFRAKKKVVVSSFGDVAASGGYYVACAGDKIVTHPGSLTGSIGVILQLPNVEGLLGKIGVRMNALKSGAMKDSGSPFRTMTEEERNYFQGVIMDAYSQFFTAVKDGRKMDDATLKPLADGRVFSGSQAVKNKLVDSLGDLEDAIEVAKDLSGLKDKKPEIVHHHDKPSLSRLLEFLSKSPVKDMTSLVRGHKTSLMYILQ